MLKAPTLTSQAAVLQKLAAIIGMSMPPQSWAKLSTGNPLKSTLPT